MYVDGRTRFVGAVTTGVDLLAFGASGRTARGTSSRGSFGLDIGNVPGITGSAPPTLVRLSASFSGSEPSACPGVVPKTYESQPGCFCGLGARARYISGVGGGNAVVVVVVFGVVAPRAGREE
jgi:hypothetical protein